MEYILNYYFPKLALLTPDDQYEYHVNNGLTYNVENHIFYQNNYNTFAMVNKIGVVIDLSCLRIRYKHLYLLKNNPNNYTCVRINNRSVNIHQLLAATFIGDLKGKVVNHIDGNKSNFQLDNLELTTYSGNNKHAMRTGLNSRSSINPIRPIRMIENGKQTIFRSMGECADYFNVSTRKIYGILNRKTIPGVYRDNITLDYYN